MRWWRPWAGSRRAPKIMFTLEREKGHINASISIPSEALPPRSFPIRWCRWVTGASATAAESALGGGAGSARPEVAEAAAAGCFALVGRGDSRLALPRG